jgi:hypothetical protein
MSKFIDYMIDEVREATENEEFNTSIGISEEEFIRFLNEAIHRLHGRIVSQHPQVFLSEEIQALTSDVQEYSLPRKAFNNNSLSQVEYSYNSNVDNYYPLKPTSLKNRHPNATGDPDFYIRRGGSVLIVPKPDNSSSSIRFTYIRKPKRLDKRRGIIKAVTTSGSNITNLEVNYINGATVDNTELLKKTRFTVVDKYGTIKMDNILLSSIDSSTSYDATLTVDSGFAFESGETIAADDYVVSGEYTTTHLDPDDFDQPLEDYIREYCRLRILQRDSSIDSREAFSQLSDMESQILNNFKELSDDITGIPIINHDEDWWI